MDLIFLFLTVFFLISLVLTGERSNTIKVIFGAFLFIAIIDTIKLKTKIIDINSFSWIISFSSIKF